MLSITLSTRQQAADRDLRHIADPPRPAACPSEGVIVDRNTLGFPARALSRSHSGFATPTAPTKQRPCALQAK